MNPLNNLTDEERTHLLSICDGFDREWQVGDWGHSVNHGIFLFISHEGDELRSWWSILHIYHGKWEPFEVGPSTTNNSTWIPNGDQWKWLPGWDMDCGSVVDEELIDGKMVKKNFIVNVFKPCDLIVAEHLNAIYAHALAWEKMAE